MQFPALSSALIALCLATASPAAAVTPREAPPLLDAIVLWLTANFDLPAPAQGPALASVAEADLVAMHYGPEASVPPGMVVAIYDDTARTIYLSDGWTGRTPADLSVLVHEMVHHLQAAAGMRFACPAEREVVAYEAQDAWLSLFGETLESAFGIDAASRLVATVCTH
jgi:hypothetical protein